MPITTKLCAHCGREFSGPNFVMKTRRYCAHDCYVKSKTQDLTGRKFGRLTAIEAVGCKKWRSLCECGNEAISSTQNLTSGRAQSCGCLNREISAALKRTHGAAGTRAHDAWSNMIQRCCNQRSKQFKDYGGRGITVCDEWRDFAGFLRDMGQPPPDHSLERRDNDKGYCKENCCWATRKEQQANRRPNRMIVIDGTSKCFTEWCRVIGISPGAGRNRIGRGWTERQALGLDPR